MKNNTLLGWIAVLASVFPANALYADNVFSKSPVEIALEKSQKSTQDLLINLERQRYYRGAILDYEVLARYTQVPMNILEAAAQMSSKRGAARNNYVVSFAEAVGQSIAEGNDAGDAVRWVLQDQPIVAEELLKLAIERVTANEVGSEIEILADRSGHFWSQVEINGLSVTMLVDTGATSVLLTQEDAKTVGVNIKNLKYDVPFNTASGVTNFANVTLEELVVFGQSFSSVEVFVSPLSDPFGSSLLGMSVLQSFSRLEFSKKQVVDYAVAKTQTARRHRRASPTRPNGAARCATPRAGAALIVFNNR